MSGFLITFNIFTYVGWKPDRSGHHCHQGSGEEHQEGYRRRSGPDFRLLEAVQGGQWGSCFLLRVPKLVRGASLHSTYWKRSPAISDVRYTYKSSGNGRRLMLERSWVRIPVLYTGWTWRFSHWFVVKIVLFVWKDRKRKRGWGWPIF